MHTNLGSFASKMLTAAAFVFALAIVSCAQASEKIIYSFTNSVDGGYPRSGLAIDSKGNLFGTTAQGGSNASCPCGTVFKLTPGSNGSWTESVIHSFGGTSNDGIFPNSQPIIDSKDNLFGVTQGGGANFQGTVYELSPGTGGTWNESVLYSFTGSADGVSPSTSRLTMDSSGNLYGLTSAGGANGFGVVFELVAGTNGTWTEKVLHSFTGNNDGGNPYSSSVVFGKGGALYGVAPQGGAHDYGVVFALLPQSDGTWVEKNLYAFTGADGDANPLGGLLVDSKGDLYGVATDVFELVAGQDGSWTRNKLHTFTGTPDGAYPEAALISDSSGNLYGTTNTGGAHTGTVFELIPGAGGNWNEKILHRFSPNGPDGVFPYSSSLAMDASGNLYGTTPSGGTQNAGVVFEVTH
jgi:uncharacterized repeat protein (TIGR03803 family)